MGSDEATLTTCLQSLKNTLREVWRSTLNRGAYATDHIGQLIKRLDDIRRVHPTYNRSEKSIGMLDIPSSSRLIESCSRIEQDIFAPCHVFVHGDFNVNNVFYDPGTHCVRYIDLYRSRYADYVQDASVFLVSNYRLPFFDRDVRDRLNGVIEEFFDFFKAFSMEIEDVLFETRMALALVRSFFYVHPLRAEPRILKANVFERSFSHGIPGCTPGTLGRIQTPEKGPFLLMDAEMSWNGCEIGAETAPSTGVTVTRKIALPDRVKGMLYSRNPDLGPRILFFSGGSALRKLSRELVRYTHNSIHVITPFDSGGSSAKLRQAFHMPAIGDVRNRLMALADQTIHGFPDIYRLFAYRFPKSGHQNDLEMELGAMIDGRHILIKGIPDPMRKIIRHHLRMFHYRMPEGFDLKGASIGNLILTSGYLENERHLDPVIYIFSHLVRARGVVRPATNRDLHLAAELEDGRTIVGQHNITGKDVSPISSRILRVYLTKHSKNPVPFELPIRTKMRELIEGGGPHLLPHGELL